MSIKLKDITPVDRYIYRLAQDLSQPFSPKELLAIVNVEHPEWKIDMINYRCKKFKKQKMLKRTGHFRSARYFCLLTETDMENAIYTFSPPFDVSKSYLVSGL